MEQTIQNIPMWKIIVSPMNPRKTFDEESIQELADNINRQGLLQPITVRPIEYADDVIDGEVVEGLPSKYEIVCGERRYRAFMLNGNKVPGFPTAIPCIVREMTDEDAFYAMVTENLQRKDVDPIEEAFAFGVLHKNGKSIEEIAARFGKSPRFIRDRIKLDALIPEMKEWVTKGLMDIGAAAHMAKLPEETQREALDEWDPDDVEDPITKRDAMNFTDDLFMTIRRADWKEDFEGPCGCTCDKCEFNNANAGCLFYEMKINRDDACCTNRDRFDAKRLAWLKSRIDEEADVLIKEGGQFETGKTVVANLNLYGSDNEEYTSLLEYAKEQGYKVVKCSDVFDRWSYYREDDERLQAKLANNEVYRVLLIENDYRSARIRVAYYTFHKTPSEDEKAGAEAMQLVQKRKENISKSRGDVAIAMREIVKEFDTSSIDHKALSDAEWLIVIELVLIGLPYTVRDAMKGDKLTISEYLKQINTPEGRDRFFRDLMKYKLSNTDVNYYESLQDLQAKLIDEWGIDAAEARARAAEKLAKKNAKIDERLLKLGYDTEGKKLAF
jgi:ParB/RepB/Spo0J family partition protein